MLRLETKQANLNYTMAAPMQNINPTILNASDLPKRQPLDKKPVSTRKPDLFDGTIFANSKFAGQSCEDDPFQTYLEKSESESESLGDDDESEEPIDEQEIYGLFIFRFRPLGLLLVF